MASLPPVRIAGGPRPVPGAAAAGEPGTPSTPSTPFTPGSCHAHVSKACKDAIAMLDQLSKVSATPYTSSHYFGPFTYSAPVEEAVYGGATHPLESDLLVSAKALIFFKSTKGGLVAGWEHGMGIMIARLPPGATNTPRWSAPCFMKVDGFQFGLVGGLEQTKTLVGVMSDKALDNIIRNNGKVSFGLDWNLALYPLEKGNENKGVSFGADFAVVSVASGLMADVAFNSTGFRIDKLKNEGCYHKGVTAAEILSGQVNPPNEALDPLIEKINFLTAQAARRMVAANAPRPGAAAAPIPQPLLQAEAPALAPGAAAPAVAAAHAVGSKPAVATTHAATTTTVVTEQ